VAAGVNGNEHNPLMGTVEPSGYLMTWPDGWYADVAMNRRGRWSWWLYDAEGFRKTVGNYDTDVEAKCAAARTRARMKDDDAELCRLEAEGGRVEPKGASR